MTREEPSTPDGRPAWTTVWATGQRPAALQRRERYTPGSVDHPAKMLPATAAHAITAYTRPGQWVLDPMCGIGTTLIEAAHTGRNGLGIELEPAWADIARTNLAHAADQNAAGSGEVHTGDARTLPKTLAEQGWAGRASLLLTSPPYGSMTHGRVRTRRDGAGKVDKWAHRYSPTPEAAQLAYQKHDDLLDSVTRMLAAARALLEPGARVVVTVRPFRLRGRLIDFPGQVTRAARRAGLQPRERCVALLCGIREGRLISRASFFQMVETTRLRRSGLPVGVTAHEDVLILANPAPAAEERQ
ncbi:TRM11 family SAM-dependent methyltransferase [Streptomonospora salina]|uniref:Methyltransferase n=1 Tax=Streptomonospora salina TaxID=104205 RepID=A0A841EGI6_9ACTN|nr:DNA methyltransferase [Streptomonospora salina]MBB6000133.1 SAM-dependent methyltransferase [Streptomonospora salina]